MTIQEMKNEILSVYKTKSWWAKVNHMYDDQIIAIYHNFNERGILGKTLRHERPVFQAVSEQPKNEQNKLEKPKEICQQLTIFDFIN